MCLDQLTAVAVTSRPGLVGSLLVGLTAAKTLALVLDIPLVDVNHVEAHLYRLPHVGRTRGLSRGRPGGERRPHAFVRLRLGRRIRIFWVRRSTTQRAKRSTRGPSCSGLGYPGGPAIQKAALSGNAAAVRFPRPLLDSPRLDFSFSGLKTALLYEINGSSHGRAVSRETCRRRASAIWPPRIKRRSSTCWWRSAGGRSLAPAEAVSVVGGGVAANAASASDWPRLGRRNVDRIGSRPVASAPTTRPWPPWRGSSSIGGSLRRSISTSPRGSCGPKRR